MKKIKNIKVAAISAISVIAMIFSLGGCFPLRPEPILVVRTDIADVSSTTAVLRGFVSLEVRAVWFEWGLDENLGHHTPAISNIVGYVETLVTGLKPGTIYYFRIVARTKLGDLVLGNIRTFMTDPF